MLNVSVFLGNVEVFKVAADRLPALSLTALIVKCLGSPGHVEVFKVAAERLPALSLTALIANCLGFPRKC